jgi:hypothetical protein
MPGEISLDDAPNEIAAAHDGVYLTRLILNGTIREVFRGNLRRYIFVLRKILSNRPAADRSTEQTPSDTKSDTGADKLGRRAVQFLPM